MKQKSLILLLSLLIMCCCLVNCKKSRRYERALLLGFLLGSSSNNQQQAVAYPPQYSMPIFLPAHGGYGHALDEVNRRPCSSGCGSTKCHQQNTYRHIVQEMLMNQFATVISF